MASLPIHEAYQKIIAFSTPQEYNALVLAQTINNIENINILTNILLLIYHHFHLSSRNINIDHYYRKVYNSYKMLYSGSSVTLKGPMFNLSELPLDLQYLIFKYLVMLS